jgi:hypothetical protein
MSIQSRGLIIISIVTITGTAHIMVLFSVGFYTSFAKEESTIFANPLFNAHAWQEVWTITLTPFLCELC